MLWYVALCYYPPPKGIWPRELINPRGFPASSTNTASGVCVSFRASFVFVCERKGRGFQSHSLLCVEGENAEADFLILTRVDPSFSPSLFLLPFFDIFLYFSCCACIFLDKIIFFFSPSFPFIFVYLLLLFNTLFPYCKAMSSLLSLSSVPLSFLLCLSLISNPGSLGSVDWLSSCSTRLCHPSWLAFITDKGGLHTRPRALRHTRIHTHAVLYPTEDPLQYPPLSVSALWLLSPSLAILHFNLFFFFFCVIIPRLFIPSLSKVLRAEIR